MLRKLEKLFPLESLNLKRLPHKLVLVLAFDTAHRLQTLASIRIPNIIRSGQGLEIKISDKIKIRISNEQSVLKLLFFKEKSGLYIAATLSGSHQE